MLGVSLVPDAGRTEELLELAVLADDLGYDVLGIQDHPYQERFLDAMAMLAVVLGRTRRIRVFPDVAVLPLRPPAMLAKAAASLDRLSGGRFVLGLGAGGYLDAMPSMDGPRLTAPQSVDALEEAMQLTRALWAGEEDPVTFEGRHHRVAGLRFGPAPSAGLELWVGGHGPRMLKLIARHADGWVPSLFRGRTAAQLAAAGHRLDEAAQELGRDPASIRRVWNVGVRIEDRVTDAGAPAAVWIERFASWQDECGATDFVIWPSGPRLDLQLEAFAESVRPAIQTG